MLFKDFEVSTVNDLSHFIYSKRLEIAEFILENGLSHLINVQNISEALVGVGTPENQVIQIMHKYLEKIWIDKELIIIDPYFLAPNNHSDYPQLIVAILQPFLSDLRKIRLFTGANIDHSVKTDVETALKNLNPALQIIYKTTNQFHDRFWISGNREKGLITGTSINGLGRRFALIDRLNKSDVREIVNELDRLNFFN